MRNELSVYSAGIDWSEIIRSMIVIAKTMGRVSFAELEALISPSASSETSNNC
jgi:hypothetical protein